MPSNKLLLKVGHIFSVSLDVLCFDEGSITLSIRLHLPNDVQDRSCTYVHCQRSRSSKLGSALTNLLPKPNADSLGSISPIFNFPSLIKRSGRKTLGSGKFSLLLKQCLMRNLASFEAIHCSCDLPDVREYHSTDRQEIPIVFIVLHQPTWKSYAAVINQA